MQGGSFPCWDEPSFKASFALTVVIPRDLLAVGNMPVTSEQPAAGDLKKVAFAPTPKMSTYLFELTVGDLERVTADAGGVTIGVVTTAGKSGQGQFALDSAVKLLGYYNDYFGVKYPLPKLDLIAVPGGFGGAMENWGAITFFESRLLFDPATNAETARRGIFGIIAHEMAHMWFGDLVTMAWWDNLWLNEGFAELDGDQGLGAVLSAMAELAERLRRQAVCHGARCAPHLASGAAADRRSTARRPRRSMPSPTTRGRR